MSNGDRRAPSLVCIVALSLCSVACSEGATDLDGSSPTRDASRDGDAGPITRADAGPITRADAGPITRADAGPGAASQGWTYDEWVVLYLTNRVRAEPDFFNREWSFRTNEAPPPSAPLRFDDLLQQAGRFQATHIDDECSLCDNHASCCVVERVDGVGQCVAPAESCMGTGVGARVRLWSPHYSGENAAAGTRGPERSVQAWIGSGGHFQNMNRGHTLLGVGRAGTIWVQDFGDDGSPPPLFAQGAHYRRTLIERTAFGSTSMLDPSDNRMFGITYYAPSAGAPRRAFLMIDGEVHDLSLTFGTEDRGAYEVEVLLTDGCHPYTFHLIDSDGVEHVDPPSGHLNAALVMDESCEFWSSP